MGHGAIVSASKKQKLNTWSSTETALVSADDMMPQLLWTTYFLDAQCYHIEDTIMYQDNQSAILLEKHGRASSSKRTKHINVRYYFITDRIQKKELSVKYCPTGEMVADFFTKPLQSKQFLEFKKKIMNV